MNEREPRQHVDVDEKTAQSDLELTRKELAETVSALADKADVKARAQQRMHRGAADLARAAEDVGCRVWERTAWLREHRRAVVATVLLTASAGFVAYLVLRRG